MAILDWLMRRNKYKHLYKFTEEDGKNSAELRALKARERQLNQKKKVLEAEAAIAELESEIYEDDEEESSGDSEDVMLMQMFSKLMGQSPQSSPPRVAPQALIEPTDEEIRAMIDNVPKKYIKMAKKMDDTALMGMIKMQVPQASATTCNKILEIFRSEY